MLLFTVDYSIIILNGRVIIGAIVIIIMSDVISFVTTTTVLVQVVLEQLN